MQLRSIGFIPALLTVMLGGLFVLKFHREAKETEYALQLKPLIDEQKFGETTLWETRRNYYFEALALLAGAESEKMDVSRVIEKATEEFEWPADYQAAFSESLIRNLRIAEQLAILDTSNLDDLGSRESLRIKSGGYAGSYAVLANIIPHRYSPEMELRFVNFLLKPEAIVKQFPDQIGTGALMTMNACRSADLITETSYSRTMAAARRVGAL